MGKTKIPVPSTNLDLLKEFGKDPCTICAGTSKMQIFCGGYLLRGHKKCSGIKNALCPDTD